ncbi:MAG: hypothetical protein EZS28_007410 [Streblomastix strix]|uniref:Uncharacterized protein n=1 Tax=Streblomastix strix TaxID=222440 RepID=A0A5J4WQ04_9EUKA|nr:MAG: hypothetical protein EZS28_007410 [Streblomastix strix]
MVAGPTMVDKRNDIILQVRYAWAIQPMPIQGIKHGKSKQLFTIWKDSSIPHGLEVEKGRIFLTQIFDRI